MLEPPYLAATMAIALIGTGLLGGAIAQRLLQQGHDLHLWNRDPSKLKPLVALGGIAASSPLEAVNQADWVVTVLSDGAVTRQILLDQIGAGLRGKRVLQIGTIGAEQSRDLARALARLPAELLETPVLGSRPEALAGTLQIMAGGPKNLFQEALPLLQDLGPEPRWMGEVGSGLETKLALNQLIASLTHAFSLSLHVVQGSGVDPEAFMAILRSSALYAPTFDKKLPKLLSGDFTNPNFPLAHLRKDLLLFLETAQAQGLHSEGLAGLVHLLERAQGNAIDLLDYSALHQLTGSDGRPSQVPNP